MDVHCTISSSCMHASLVTQSCPTLCNPLDCRLPGSSVHGIIYTGVGCHALLQRIFQTQGLNPCPTSHVSPALQADSLPDEPLWKPLLVNVKPGLGENDAGGRGRNGQDHGYSRRSSKVTDLLRSES